MRPGLAWALLPLVALVAVLPLLWNGCSCGHDFDFHLLSWMEAAAQFRHGNLHPQWAFTPAYNAGEPRFVFYPPLSWTVGAVLGLVMPWGAVPVVYTWLALTAAALGCYRLLREFAAPGTAVLVAAVYSVNPYLLFTAYERTAYAELLAAAWLPLLVHGVLRRRVTATGIAVPVALLWVTNAPAAVIGCYGLAVLAAVRLAQRRAEDGGAARLIGRTVGGTALGLGVAAFYIVPAAYERRFVQIAMAMTEGMRIADNFLFHRTADAAHDEVLRTASLLAVGLLGVAVVALGAAWGRCVDDRRTVAALAVLPAVIGVLLVPVSAPVWRVAPELAFLQFPWRLLALLTPVLAVAVTIALRGVRLGWVRAGAVLVTGVLVVAGYGSFRQACDAEDTVAARLALFRSAQGTEPTDEYTPVAADNDVLGKANPAYWLGASAGAAPPAGSGAGRLQWPVDVSSPVPRVLILNLREWPGWRVTLNSALVAERLERDDGLMAIPVPAGASHLAIAYARTADQTVGWSVSALSLAALAALRFRRRRPS